MILGGLPLLALSVWQRDPALSGHIQDLSPADWGALFYTSLFGSAISYGVFFYNATRGADLYQSYNPPGCVSVVLLEVFGFGTNLIVFRTCRQFDQIELSHVSHSDVRCFLWVIQHT